MFERKMHSKTSDKTYLIYLVCTAIYFVRMFYLNFPVGVLCGVVTVLLSIPVIPLIFRLNKNSSFIDSVLYLFVIWNLLSIVHYLYNGISLSVFFSDALSSFLPIIFYFHAKKSNKEKTYKVFCVVTSLITVFGIIIYLTMPSFYVSFLKFTDSSGRFIVEAFARDGRLTSIYNSTIIGMLCCFAVAISLYQFLLNSKKIYFVYLLINSLGVFLCYQRSTIAITFLLYVVFFLIFIFSKKVKAKQKITVLLFLLFFIVAGFFGIQLLESYVTSIDFERYIAQFISRIDAMDGMISERTGQWISALSFPKSLFFGSGLGSVGHQAIGYNSVTVRDGNIIKMLCELGIGGLSIFTILFFAAFFIGLKKRLLCEVSIIVVGLLHCIGSNGLSLFISGFLFWYAIGLINSEEKISFKQGEKHENNRCYTC